MRQQAGFPAIRKGNGRIIRVRRRKGNTKTVVALDMAASIAEAYAGSSRCWDQRLTNNLTGWSGGDAVGTEW